MRTSSDGTTDVVAGWFTDNAPAPMENHYPSPENPAYPVDAYDALVSGGSVSDAGIRVGHRNNTHIGAVWQAVLQISGSISGMPLELFSRDANGNVTLARDHPAYYPVKHQPNEDFQAVKFWRRHMVHVLLWGNGYVWADRTIRPGQVQLYHLLPDRTFPERIDSELYYSTEVNAELYIIPASDVMHVELIVDIDLNKGLDPTAEARDAWGLALARTGFASKFFRMGGRVGGILETSAATPKPRRDAVEKTFREVYENPDQAFRTVVLREGAKFHAAQHTFSDTQLVESSRDGVRDVARWFNLKPSRLGEEGGQGYGSKQEDNRDYVDTTLGPHMAMIRGEASRVLLTEQQRRREEYEFRYNTDELLKESRLQRYQGHQIGIQSEILNPNEARRMEGLNDRDGGDQYGNPNINPQKSAVENKLLESCLDVPAVLQNMLGERIAQLRNDYYLSQGGKKGRSIEAHANLITDSAEWAARVVAGKRLRQKGSDKPMRSEWWREQADWMAERLAPSVEAYTSIFGGSSSAICGRIAEEVAYLLRQSMADTVDATLAGADIRWVIKGAIDHV